MAKRRRPRGRPCAPRTGPRPQRQASGAKATVAAAQGAHTMAGAARARAAQLSRRSARSGKTQENDTHAALFKGIVFSCITHLFRIQSLRPFFSNTFWIWSTNQEKLPSRIGRPRDHEAPADGEWRKDDALTLPCTWDRAATATTRESGPNGLAENRYNGIRLLSTTTKN